MMPEKSLRIIRWLKRDGSLGLDASVTEDVPKLGAAVAEHLPDQQSAVAFERFAAAAQDRVSQNSFAEGRTIGFPT